MCKDSCVQYPRASVLSPSHSEVSKELFWAFQMYRSTVRDERMT